jgi:Fe-S cluster assembly protein SufB
MKEELAKQWCIFVSSSEGLMKHPEIFRHGWESYTDMATTSFSALNYAVFSGGSFIYIPKGVKLKHPFRPTFRIKAENGPV